MTQKMSRTTVHPAGFTWEDQAGTELSPWLLCVTRTCPGWQGRNPYADALRDLAIVPSGSRSRQRSHAETAHTLWSGPPWPAHFPFEPLGTHVPFP